MAKLLTRLAQFIAFVSVAALGLSHHAYGGTTLTVSDEVFGNNITTRTKANALDDAWAASFASGPHRPDLFVGGAGYTGSKAFTDPTGASYQVDWEVGRINQIGPGLPTSTTFINATGGSVTYGPSTSIQSASPNPYSTDTRLSTSVSGVGLKAVKLDFTNSTTDIYEFGIYIGDLESRPVNGTDGRVIVFNPSGGVIGDFPIVYTGTIQTSGADISYTVTEPLGSPTGAANNNNGDWGNATTAFLSIASDEVIGSVIIHVGDDDHTTNNSGSTEQLGLTGFQIPAEPIVIGNAVLTAEKTIALFDTTLTAYALPGDDVIYSITVANEGDGAADTDSIFIVDELPSEVVFYNGDIDGPGPETAAVKFTQTTAGLTLNAATDVAYSNNLTKPTTVSACNYTPIAGYDIAVKFICFSPKGAMLNGSPNPEFTVSFRAQIK